MNKILTLFLIFSLTGCSSDKKGSPPSAPQSSLIEFDKLKGGFWQSECYPEPKNGKFQNTVALFDLSDEGVPVMAMYTEIFEDDQCTQSLLGIIFGSRADLKQELNGEGQKIDLHMQIQKIYIFAEPVASLFNNESVCGKTDWVLDVEMGFSILGLSCPATESVNIGSVYGDGEVFSQILMIKDGKLYFGDTTTKTGKTDALRPNTLDSHGLSFEAESLN